MSILSRVSKLSRLDSLVPSIDPAQASSNKTIDDRRRIRSNFFNLMAVPVFVFGTLMASLASPTLSADEDSGSTKVESNWDEWFSEIRSTWRDFVAYLTGEEAPSQQTQAEVEPKLADSQQIPGPLIPGPLKYDPRANQNLIDLILQLEAPAAIDREAYAESLQEIPPEITDRAIMQEGDAVDEDPYNTVEPIDTLTLLEQARARIAELEAYKTRIEAESYARVEPEQNGATGSSSQISRDSLLSYLDPLRNNKGYPSDRQQPKELIFKLNDPGAEEQSGDGSIPAVMERELDVEEAERIWVTNFEVINVTEYPDLGITNETLGQVTYQALQDKRSSEDIKKYGYSIDEMGEIAEFFNELIGQQASVDVSPEDLQKLIKIVNRQKELRGFTVTEIEQVADRITQFYRKRGLFLATAYVPVQEVKNGVVQLAVLDGTLGGLEVSGNKRYNKNFFEEPFQTHLGKVVTESSVEQSLYLLNDLPGLDVFGYFSKGRNVGETLLKLNVQSEDVWGGSIRLDNDGSESTGEVRGFAVLEWFNPAKVGDYFRIGALQSESPSNSTYGLIEYRTAIYDSRTFIDLYANSNEYELQLLNIDKTNGNSFEVVGSVVNTGVSLERKMIRSRKRNLNGKFEFVRKVSDITFSNNFDRNKITAKIPGVETLRNVVASVSGDRLFEEYRLLSQGMVELSYGQVGGDKDELQEDSFSKVKFDALALTFFTPFFSEQQHRFLARAHGQYSEEGLPAVEQIVIGGANAVRGFTISDFAADSAFHLSFEWVMPFHSAIKDTMIGDQSLNEVLQFYLFADAGYGHKTITSLAAGGTEWVNFSALGIGLQYNIASSLTGRLDVAVPVGDKHSATYESFIDDDPKAYFDLTWHF